MAEPDRPVVASLPEWDEKLSALADGHWPSQTLTDGDARVLLSDQSRQKWYRYHLVGDVLRTGQSLSRPSDAAVIARLSTRLAQEPPHSRPQCATDLVALTSDATRARLDFHAKKPVANDGLFSWRLASGLAAVMLVASLGWQLGGPWAEQARGAQLAGAGQRAQPVTLESAQASANVPVPPATLLRDPALDAVLQAQRPASGAPVSPGAAGLVRNATFQGVGR